MIQAQITKILIITVAGNFTPQGLGHSLRGHTALLVQVFAHLSQGADAGFFRPAKIVTGSTWAASPEGFFVELQAFLVNFASDHSPHGAVANGQTFALPVSGGGRSEERRGGKEGV